MKSLLGSLLLAMALLLPSQALAAARWSDGEIATLRKWVEAAPAEGLPPPSSKSLDRAITSGVPEKRDAAADQLALELARMHLLGAATTGERTGWHIEDTDREIDLATQLDRAVWQDELNAFFAGLRPRHPDYAILRKALSTETDADRRIAIARNMERWRWMPRVLGPDFLIVNAPAFGATLWRNGEVRGRWRVIVGKTRTPTPVFGATVTGVNFNPWWYVPASIVRESIGALVRRNPSAARARGYVWGGGSYRQRPGPTNALGQMKLVMPNPYKVYLHDTPNKDLFEQDVRAFSHGCIRVGDALGLAATLLDDKMGRDEIDAILDSRETETVTLSRELPIYITYFTAFADADGAVQVVPDIYNRDGRIRVPPAARDAVRAAAVGPGEGCPGQA